MASNYPDEEPPRLGETVREAIEIMRRRWSRMSNPQEQCSVVIPEENEEPKEPTDE
jgi:hypothetical protein